MTRSAIIVAGGSGTRMGSDIPKQFLLIKGKPVLAHTIEAFKRAYPDMRLIVVLPAEHMETWRMLGDKHAIMMDVEIVEGGSERAESVANGLALVDSDLVAVHDGVRPLASVELIRSCFEGAVETGAAVPVIPISSSVRRINGRGNEAVDRKDLRAVQTPQCFKTAVLKNAFHENPSANATDEASLVEMSGQSIHLIEGEERNIKITTLFDLRLAEQYLN